MQILSSLIIPLLVLFIILYGIYKKVDIYDVFVNGSKESYDMIISMFPCMLAMIFGVNIFVKSGFLEWLFSFFKDILNNINNTNSIITMAIMRPNSGSDT